MRQDKHMDSLRTLKKRRPRQRARGSGAPLPGDGPKPSGIHIRKYLREKAVGKK
jgi:hypothetical protein